MKALIIDNFDSSPRFVDNFPMPEKDSKYDTLIKVLATPIENIDKGVASGKHYSSKYWHPSFPSIPGPARLAKKSILTNWFICRQCLCARSMAVWQNIQLLKEICW